VANILRARIVNWDSRDPVRLPGERELCEAHRASRATIRRALEVLRDERLLERLPGKGTVTLPAGIRAWRRLRRSKMIKVVTSWMSAADVPPSFYGQVYQGILVRGGQSGYNLSTKRVSGPFPPIDPDYRPEDPERIVGVIVVAVMDERFITMHTQAGYPVVVVDYWSGDPAADCIMVDCFSEGLRAVDFLLNQGHHEMFFVGNLLGKGAYQQHECDADLMLAGCRRALEQAGLSLPPERVLFWRREIPDVTEVVRWYASLKPRPTAGIIFDRVTLAEFIKALPAVNFRCPRDVSLITKMVTGYNSDASAFRSDGFLLGQLAVDVVLERASGKRETAAKLVVPSIFQRGNTVRRADE
jgi:DNA-binding LacI/PurR family transcriptional regulator